MEQDAARNASKENSIERTREKKKIDNTVVFQTKVPLFHSSPHPPFVALSLRTAHMLACKWSSLLMLLTENPIRNPSFLFQPLKRSPSCVGFSFPRKRQSRNEKVCER
jgi:hypothetical protein